jgi:glycosyltransferase involved in cell wall biosynthesis
MKILFVHQNLTGNTGESVESKQAIQSLLRQGMTVGALYRRYNEPAIKDPDGDYVDLGCLDFKSNSIARKIQEFRPDIGHVKSCWTPFHAKAARLMRKSSIPYILEPGGHFLPVHFTTRFAGRPFGFWRKMLKRVYQEAIDKPMLKGASLVRALSPYEAISCKTRFGVESFALHLGINQEWYVPNPAVRQVGEDGVVQFLFVARLDIFQKGMDLLLKASQQLASEGFRGEFRVILAGPPLGDSDIRLRAMISEMGMDDCVSVVPPVRDAAKIALFNTSHVFIHPSRFEEMAKLPREAVATGMPVIASRESNFGDWAESESFGIAAELSVDSIAAAMRRFIVEKDFVTSCSKAAIDFASRSSWDAVAQSLIPHYHKLTLG